MIEFESAEIRRQAVALWQEAFGDSEEYITFFFGTHSGCRVLTEVCNDELASMLFLIDGAVLTRGERLPAFYLFAACTFKRFRGMGHMSRLLKKAGEFSARQGREYIALVPAESSLFGYYGRYGYKTAFYYDSVSADRAGCIKMNGDRFDWCDAHREYIRAECLRFGGETVEADGEIFTVADGKIKAPPKAEPQRYGMLLPLTQRAEELLPDRAYIGLTLE